MHKDLLLVKYNFITFYYKVINCMNINIPLENPFTRERLIKADKNTNSGPNV